MAETVQHHVERMLPELQDLLNRGIYSQSETQQLLQKRTQHEYRLKRKIPKKFDFVRYIEAEYNFNVERLTRKKQLKVKWNGGVSDFASVRRIFNIFDRALTVFKHDLQLWTQYISLAKRLGGKGAVRRIYLRALQMHPLNVSLWVSAAKWEYEENLDVDYTRRIYQRALRLIPESKELWLEYFKMELLFIRKITLRQAVLQGQDVDMMAVNTVEGKQDEGKGLVSQTTSQTGQDVDEMEEDNLATGEDYKQLDSITVADSGMNADVIQERKKPSQESTLKDILDFALPRIIFKNAVKAIPNDPNFRLKFIYFYQHFEHGESAIQEIIDTLKEDFPTLQLPQNLLKPTANKDTLFSDADSTSSDSITHKHLELKQRFTDYSARAREYERWLEELSYKINKREDLSRVVLLYLDDAKDHLKDNLQMDKLFLSIITKYSQLNIINKITSMYFNWVHMIFGNEKLISSVEKLSGYPSRDLQFYQDAIHAIVQCMDQVTEHAINPSNDESDESDSDEDEEESIRRSPGEIRNKCLSLLNKLHRQATELAVAYKAGKSSNTQSQSVRSPSDKHQEEQLVLETWVSALKHQKLYGSVQSTQQLYLQAMKCVPNQRQLVEQYNKLRHSK